MDTTDDDTQRILAGGEGLLETDALRAIKTVLADRCVRYLLLSGATGRGKSLAARHALAERGGLRVHAGDLARPRAFDAVWSIEDATKVRLLVVDDLGVEARTEFAAGQVEQVLCDRECAPLLTIITTNLTYKDVTARYGERLASRVRGKGGIVQTCTGPDLRARRDEGGNA